LNLEWKEQGSGSGMPLHDLFKTELELTLLPALDELFPFIVMLQVSPEEIMSAGRGFPGGLEQGHLGFFQRASAFAMIAGGAGGNHIRPGVGATQMLGHHVVDGEIVRAPPAVLAGIIIAAEDLAAGKPDLHARAVDHLIKSNYGRDGDRLCDSLEIAAAVHHQVGFSR
jgi:hypothetical protein